MIKILATAIFAAEQTGKKVEKFEALSGLSVADQQLVWQCFNPYRVFNVRKYDWPKAFASDKIAGSTYDHSYEIFFKLLDQLNDRVLTGGAARNAVTAVLGLYTENTAKALARVLNKDLDCGAGRDTFEKIYPNLNIPRFDLMLAAKIEEKNEHRKKGDVALTEAILAKKYKLTFPLIAEAKYDGNRLVSFIEDGVVSYNSRSGKESGHLIGIFDAELALIEKGFGEPVVIDGEVLADSFQQTMHAKGSDRKSVV